MAGLGDVAGARGRVDDRVDAGGERRRAGGLGRLVHPGRHRVEPAQHLLRGQPQVGQGMRRGTQLHHDRRRLRPVAHRVPDDQCRPAARQRDDVVPVAAHDVVPDRQVDRRDLQARRDPGLAGQQAPLQRLRGPLLPGVQPGVVDAHRRAGGQFPGQRDVTGVERGAGRRARERRASHDDAAGDQRHGQERGVALGDLQAAGVTGEPLGALAVDVVGQDRLARRHRLRPGGVRAQEEHLAGGQQAAGDRLVLADQPGRQPPHRRAVPGLGRADLTRGEQALGRIDDGRVGEPGHRGLDDLGRGLGEVQAAADPGRGLAQPPRRGRRPGPRGDHQHGAARPGQRFPAQGEPSFAQRTAGHGGGVHPPGRGLGQRQAHQLALARAGHQHVTNVAPDHGALLEPEQRRGGHRPGNHPAGGIKGERGEAAQVRLAPPRQPERLIPGHR